MSDFVDVMSEMHEIPINDTWLGMVGIYRSISITLVVRFTLLKKIYQS